jgi:hypothetical protein
MLPVFGIRRRPFRVYPVRRLTPVYIQSGGQGTDIFYNTTNEGSPGPEGPAGPPGEPGVSVVNAYMSSNPGDLFIELSDGQIINAGNVIGPPGPQGPSGNCNTVNVKLVATDYTAADNDCYVGATNNNIELTLPAGIAGKVYIIKNQANGNIKVESSNGQKIDSASSVTLGTNNSLTVIFDGSRWNVI